MKKANENAYMNQLYKVGDIYITTNSANPSTRFGGTWELKRTYYGGELIGFCEIHNTISNSSPLDRDRVSWFSDATFIPSKRALVVNYVPSIITFHGDAALIKPQGIAGMCKVHLALSGHTDSGNIASVWFEGNHNQLPTGVTMLPDNSNNCLKYFCGSTYGGTSNDYIYHVDDTTPANAEFYINPKFYAYGGPLYLCDGGVICSLMVEVYAKGGTSYMWERIS